MNDGFNYDLHRENENPFPKYKDGKRVPGEDVIIDTTTEPFGGEDPLKVVSAPDINDEE